MKQAASKPVKATTAAKLPNAAAEKMFDTIAAEQMSDPRVTARKMFGARGLFVADKAFGMIYKGRLVVKLSAPRVDALVKAKKGDYFEPGAGRKMKSWFSFKPGRSAGALFEEAKEFTATTAQR